MPPTSWRKRVNHQLTAGRLRPVAAPIYDLITNMELAGVRVKDRFSPSPQVNHSLLNELTAVVKTFERPTVLNRLLASIRRYYPQLNIIVVDDSRQARPVEGVETVVLPFNSGVSAGRRAGLEKVTTQYTLVLDDDFIFYGRTDIVHALTTISRQAKIDILGGQVVDLPFFTTVNYHQIVVPNIGRSATLPPGSTIAGLPVLDKVPNFFIGRTDRLRLVDWQPEIKVIEHGDFFVRAKGILTTVFDDRFRCLHAQTPFDLNYRQYRKEYLLDSAILKHRYNQQNNP